MAYIDANRPYVPRTHVQELPDLVQIQNWRQINPKGEVHPPYRQPIQDV